MQYAKDQQIQNGILLELQIFKLFLNRENEGILMDKRS